MSCSCWLLWCQSILVLWSLHLIRGMDYSKFRFSKWEKGNSVLTLLLLARISVKSEQFSSVCVCCNHRLLILGDFWVQVFILTRGAVGFIINEVFFLMFPSCQSPLSRGWSISVCALMSSSIGALSSAPHSYRCFRTGRGLTKVDSDVFSSLLVFFHFLFRVGFLQKTHCLQSFSQQTENKCLTLWWEKSRGSSKFYLYK